MLLRSLFIMMSLCGLLLTACQSEPVIESPDVANEQSKQEDTEQPKPEAMPIEEKNKQLFLEQVSLGMSEEEVRQLFGSNFTLVQNAMEGNETWRYDIGTEDSYLFNDQGIDQVDMDGLMNGRVKQQLFLDWSNEGLLHSATLFNLQEDGKGFEEYRLLPDGTREEEATDF